VIAGWRPCSCVVSFVRKAHKETEVEHALRVACESLDTQKTGTVLVSELRKAMAAASDGEEIGGAELQEMIEEAGAAAGDERVHYAKFIKAMYADDDGGDAAAAAASS
jgi:Ca2+-binding EF-hand superfamily protein